MSEANRVDRRGFLGGTMSVAAGALAAGAVAGQAVSGSSEARAADAPATPAPATPAPPAAAQGNMPCGMIGKVKVSRMMLGGNLVSGCMHSRDLAYVGPLFRAYVTEEKIFETFKLAEEHGINTVFESGLDFVVRYNKLRGGHMQIIPSIHPDPDFDPKKIRAEVKGYIDAGVPAVYIWGVAGDSLTKLGKVDVIARTVETAKEFGIPVGVGAHSLSVPVACEKAKVPCDFYVKTLHTDSYPSAVPKHLRKDYIWLDGGEGFYDNMWCIEVERTVEFMKSVAKPWIAFKVLAAGAIHPQQGFAHAFRSGADFIAVGMFDFQIKQNCEIAGRIVRREKDRARPWRA